MQYIFTLIVMDVAAGSTMHTVTSDGVFVSAELDLMPIVNGIIEVNKTLDYARMITGNSSQQGKLSFIRNFIANTEADVSLLEAQFVELVGHAMLFKMTAEGGRAKRSPSSNAPLGFIGDALSYVIGTPGTTQCEVVDTSQSGHINKHIVPTFL